MVNWGRAEMGKWKGRGSESRREGEKSTKFGKKSTPMVMDSVFVPVVFISFTFVYKQIYKASYSAVSVQRWPKPSPVLSAPTHGGVSRLSGPG